MGSKLYVGNLSYNVTDSDLEQLCAQHGTVSSVSVITDRETGRPRGFAFVEMSDPGSASRSPWPVTHRQIACGVVYFSSPSVASRSVPSKLPL